MAEEKKTESVAEEQVAETVQQEVDETAQKIAELEKDYLELSDFEVTIAGDGVEGLGMALEDDYDLVILDLMLPGMDGFEICKRIREEKNTPILMVSAKRDDIDKIRGLSLGADDYITKPFSMEELTFRIEAILRRVRGKKNKESNVYKIGKFTFDTQKQILAIGDKQTKLTTKESELLGLLCAHANEILQRDFALKTIWIDDNYFNARSMDVYITKLRKHLKDDDSIEIINIHGKGYKLITPEPES